VQYATTSTIVQTLAFYPYGKTRVNANGVNIRYMFTDKELEPGDTAGLYYFGARYYDPGIGRFMSADTIDPDRTNPQTLNRYSYTVNNPLRYVDPDGRDWVPTGQRNNPFSWVDQCSGSPCFNTVASVIGTDFRVYGLGSDRDIQNYPASSNGLIDVDYVANHSYAMYQSSQTPGQEENFLGLNQAAALFNTAEAYHQVYPNDANLVFTGGSTAQGSSALNPASGRPLHRQSHLNGRNIDLRYMDENGQPLIGNHAAGNGDVNRTIFLLMEMAAQPNANLRSLITGEPARYGLGPLDPVIRNRHLNHMHLQFTYPAPP
jgi:RHS repeat-associated protein